MAGHFEFAEAAHKNGIKPILGCEFYLAKNRYDKSTTAEDGSKKGREKLSHLTVLAQNRIGYQNMLQLGFEASNPITGQCPISGKTYWRINNFKVWINGS